MISTAVVKLDLAGRLPSERTCLSMKNNKNRSRRTRRHTNLENFAVRERIIDKNGWQDYVHQADECALHGS